MDLNRKVAVVTGAGTGIGKATARALLKAGYCAVLVGRRAEPLERTAAESGAGPRVLAVPADVRDPESVGRLFQKTKEAFGRVDLLFNNAGVSGIGIPFEDLTLCSYGLKGDVDYLGTPGKMGRVNLYFT